MAREIAITIYLIVFRLIFQICKLCPQKKKSTFVASFGDNVLYTVQALEELTDVQVVVLKTAQCKVRFDDVPSRIVLNFEPRQFLQWIRSIYHLATSTHVFVDNYFGFLAVSAFKENVACTQLWHAAGAVKQFGLKDPSNANRTPKAIARFQQVYNRFNHVVVGSEKMAEIFKQSFGLQADRMLRTGIPRTDFFFDEKTIAETRELLQRNYPIINKKKVILYAPTFRDHELHVGKIALDVTKMYEALHKDYVLLLRLHPAVKASLPNSYPDFIVDVSSYPDVNHLLVVTDILVSDYSSIPFEFALMKKPMIFFAYDLEEYAEARGFWEKYEDLVPGPIVTNTDELIEIITNEEFDMERVTTFANEWNMYSNGQSSKQLIHALYPESEEQPVTMLQ